MTEQVNINIVEGEPFFAHEANVNFTPTQLTLDCKCITPRNDPRSKKPSFQIKHNVIMFEPWHAKALVGALASAVEKYEKEFGKVKKPSSVTKAEKKQKKANSKKKKKTKGGPAPTYMG